MDKGKKQKIALIFLAGFSLFIEIESWRLGVGSFHAPGPGFLSAGAALAILLLSLFMLLKGQAGVAKKEAPFFGKKAKNVIYILGGIFVFPLLLSRAGFLLCTFFFTGYCLKMIAPQSWKTVLAMSLGVTILSYLIFDAWLMIQLPKGTWMNQFLRMADSLWK
jgi:hypothetical protein